MACGSWSRSGCTLPRCSSSSSGSRRSACAGAGFAGADATGAAAAAVAGYLRDLGWPHGGAIEIVQGEDMGSRSRLRVEMDDVPGTPVRVSGRVRDLDPPA